MKELFSLNRLLFPFRAAASGGRSGSTIVTGSHQSPARRADTPGGWSADLHPLHRRFLAYRAGTVDGRQHSLEEAADYFGIDPATARLTDQYILARRRLEVARSGWRATRLGSRPR